MQILSPSLETDLVTGNQVPYHNPMNSGHLSHVQWTIETPCAMSLFEEGPPPLTGKSPIGQTGSADLTDRLDTGATESDRRGGESRSHGQGKVGVGLMCFRDGI